MIDPYLQENERIFDIRVDDQLSVAGKKRTPGEVYRKVQMQDANLLRENENR